MSSQKLRPYQEDACVAVQHAWHIDNLKRVIIAMPTASGKTTTLAEIILRELQMGRKVLALAHRKELLGQMYHRFKDHCGLEEHEIGIEQAHNVSPLSAKVVIGSMATVVKDHRLLGFIPDLIIIDECHRAAAASYREIVKRFKDLNPNVRLLGCTATPKRSDRSSLYAINVDGSAVMLKHKKTGREFAASPDTSVFEKLVYDLPLFDAICDGWIVDMVGIPVKTATNLDRVDTNGDDFVQSQLQKIIDNERRTDAAITGWKQVCPNRQTIVFAAGIEHAEHVAAAWRDAGYTAEAIHSKTPDDIRYEKFQAFRKGQLQVLVNMGIYTEGADIPECSCAVLMRPTKSWGLYMQMIGRTLRPLPGIVDFEGSTDESRKVAIALSAKPDAIILDIVDVCSKHDVCSIPGVLDVPANVKSEGHKLTEVKEAMERVKLCPEAIVPPDVTYQEIEVILDRVKLVRGSMAKSKPQWRATVDGYRLADTMPGYEATLKPSDDRYPGETDDWYTLSIRHGHELPFFEQRCSIPVGFDHALDHAAQSAHSRIQGECQRRMDEKEKGTVRRLQKLGTGGLYRALRANRYKDDEIEKMNFDDAKKLARDLVVAYQARHRV